MIDVVRGAADEGWMSECGTVGMLEQNENLLVLSLCCVHFAVCSSLGPLVWHAGFSQGKY